MPKVYYEYRDARGRMHRVDSIGQVPKKYMHTMMATGVEDPEEQQVQQPKQATTTASGKPILSELQRITIPTGGIPFLIPGTLCLLFLYFKGFLMRSLIVGMLAIWALYAGWGLFENSPYSKTRERAPRKVMTAQDCENSPLDQPLPPECDDL